MIHLYLSRITPAGAGNRPDATSARRSCSDHPRGCGEQHPLHTKKQFFEGSPPRVRGTVILTCKSIPCIGITPAGAGNSCFQHVHLALIKDHPRGCGEQFAMPSIRVPCGGSPPRVRGTDFQIVRYTLDQGITPAGAGNSDRQLSQTPTIGDHPRGCGEQTMRRHKQLLRVGSPPRVRGTATPSPDPVQVPGITPAGAGNSRLKDFSCN